MGIWLGDTEASNIYIGDTEVAKIFLGTTQVWPATGGTLFQMTPIGFAINTVCQQISRVPHYHDGDTPYPDVGDIVYTDAAMQTPVSGGLQYFNTDTGYLQIDASGQVTSNGGCVHTTSSTAANATSVGACGDTPVALYYIVGPDINPAVGDRVYTDLGLTTPLVGNDQWYKVEVNDIVTVFVSIQVDNDGYITNKNTCV